MCVDKSGWIGVGETPRDAVHDLIPNKSRSDIAWIEGVNRFPARPTPTKDSISGSITVIYESESPEQWKISVVKTDTAWEACLIGGKNLPF